MKSSDEGSGDLLKNYFKVFYRPSEVVGDLFSKPMNLSQTFIIIVISSILLISGIFIGGGVLYTTFHDYAYTYPLEILTSGQVFGYYLPYGNINYYVLVFLTDFIFCIKAWLFLTVIFFAFLRLFKQQISIKRAAQVIAWSIFPFAIIMFGAALVCRGLQLILPGIYHFIYFGVLATVFIIIAPIVIHLFLEQLKVSAYNAMRSYYLSLFVVFVIFTFNHADKIMNLIW